MDILIVEDNKELADLLCDFLRKENYTVSVAETGEKALALYERYGARLIVLDIMLPGIDGFGVCKKIREKGNTPILIVSAKTEKEDKLNGFNFGADDYIDKPYDIDIMLAKISGIFKRRYSVDEIVDGCIRINKVSRVVYKNDIPLETTAKEFDLLLLLMENKGRTLSKEYIFGEGYAAGVAAQLEVPVLAEIPLDKSLHTDKISESSENIFDNLARKILELLKK